ncbi:hypothetical protein N4T20_02480 [Flavobacterium sp. TR2]|uniref:hypothetical protein n=1 Tax=Flavobacterium sp. TR2 TaxID=2977321 RepID=UPI0021B13889|nr:hypothetical protein [Flavobacterium sp. TR2]UWY28797.1 hypothetical protein N4T20_02480 [Flavobacterium sp. TR2]
MALDKERLKEKIKDAFQAEQTEQEDHNASLERISDKLAQAIVEEIKALKIEYTSGLVAPSGGGTVTGTILHTVS